MLADDRNGLSRSDVVPRSPIIVTRSIKVLLDDLLSSRKSVAAAHLEIMTEPIEACSVDASGSEAVTKHELVSRDVHRKQTDEA